jgi:hypothetical protein
MICVCFRYKDVIFDTLEELVNEYDHARVMRRKTMRHTI